MKKWISVLLCLLMTAGLLTGCGNQANSTNDESNEKISIVTTIFPVYDWTRAILGDNADHAELTMLLDNGVDLHSYQPTADDIVKISACDLFVYVGGAVNYIGRYPYNPTWHAIDYISSGGLNTITGSWSQVKVWRGDKLKAIDINVASDPVLPGDVIEIPKSHYESFKDFTLFMASLLSVISSAFIIYVNYK